MLTLTKEHLANALSHDAGRECLSWLIARWCQRHGITVRSGIVAAIICALEAGELQASWDGISEELLEIERTPTLDVVAIFQEQSVEDHMAKLRAVLGAATRYLAKHPGELPS